MITVVIPVYNRPEKLRRALQSLAEQTVKDFDVVICDDGSEEDIESVVNSFMSRLDLRYLRLKHTGMPAKPRNVGIAHASGEWISFLDSDDWWSPHRIKVVSDHLTNKVDLLYHPLKIAHGVRSKLGWAKYIGRAIEGNPLTDMLSRGNPIPTSSVIVRKSLLDKIGGLYEDKALFDDFDAWLSFASQAACFLFIRRPLGYYWIDSDRISEISERQINRQRTLFARHCNNLPDKLTRWAKSYNNYMVGTYLLYLGRSQDALAALRDADFLRLRSQRFKRLVKIVIASIKFTLGK